MKQILTLALLLMGLSAQAQTSVMVPSLDDLQDGIHHWNLFHKERHYNRYADNDYHHIADNLLAYQNTDGGWMKNIDWLGILDTDSVKAALSERNAQSTLDNSNTFPQIEYLAEVYAITGETKYRDGALHGIIYLLDTQKDNGGWRGWDVDAITFNDEVSTGCLRLFQRILQGDKKYQWLDKKTLKRIRTAYDRGIDMVLKTQYVQNGVKTVWGQQHDNVTLQPCKARSFELPGLTARESCPVIELLMGIKDPSPEVVNAVDCAVAWLENNAIHGIRIERITLPEDKQYNHEYPYDNVVVNDSTAPRIWARFYELSDNTPFFCQRWGKKVSTLADVDGERRTGYDWYGYWPETVIKHYKEWKKLR